MNPGSVQCQRENQQRLFEALRRISEDNYEGASLKVSCHAMPGPTNYLSEPHLLPTSDLASSSDPDDPADADCLSLDFHDQSDSGLSYEPISSVVDGPPLQVDRNGSKVEHSLASAWVPASMFSDISRPVSMSAPSSMRHYSSRLPATASVFAAAVTAAMIVERPDSVPKRPRSPSSDSMDEDYLADHDTDDQDTDDTDDNTTEASLDESEAACNKGELYSDLGGSPRSVVACFKPRLSLPSVPEIGFDSQEVLPVPASVPDPVVVDAVQNRTVLEAENSVVPAPEPAPQRAMPLSSYNEAPRNALLSRKRRAEAMERFRRKKAVRCYGRRVRYQIRKRIATTRPRVNGRFARRVDAESQTPTRSRKEQ